MDSNQTSEVGQITKLTSMVVTHCGREWELQKEDGTPNQPVVDEYMAHFEAEHPEILKQLKSGI